MPCHHNLEEYLSAYLDGAGLRDDPKRALFPSLHRAPGRPLTRNPMHQANAHAMIRRRARAAGVATAIGNPGDRDHGVSEERRHTGKSRVHGQPRLDPHDAALRSPAGRDARCNRANGFSSMTL
jgi:hypothetical protein